MSGPENSLGYFSDIGVRCVEAWRVLAVKVVPEVASQDPLVEICSRTAEEALLSVLKTNVVDLECKRIELITYAFSEDL